MERHDPIDRTAERTTGCLQTHTRLHDAIEELAALDEVRDHEESLRLVEEVERADDVRVVDLAQDSDLSLRHLVDPRLARLEHDLDGDRRRRRVNFRERAHDDAEAAAAELGTRSLVAQVHVVEHPRRVARLEEAQ